MKLKEINIEAIAGRIAREIMDDLSDRGGYEFLFNVIHFVSFFINHQVNFIPHLQSRTSLAICLGQNKRGTLPRHVLFNILMSLAWVPHFGQ